jgi:hypothetical protein
MPMTQDDAETLESIEQFDRQIRLTDQILSRMREQAHRQQIYRDGLIEQRSVAVARLGVPVIGGDVPEGCIHLSSLPAYQTLDRSTSQLTAEEVEHV